ncbi:MAG: hypothetical protein HKM93_22060 [Desulfobacteraceae bacterium]|nr:hypothetical protein [Desulfobacteraceae bacterium]
MSDKPSYEELEARVLQLELEKEESVRTLAGGVAHGFNNLLMGIQGSVSLLALDADMDTATREHLDRIEHCVSEMSRLTDQLVGFARCGKYETKQLQLNQVIDTVTDAVMRENGHLRVEKELQERLWPILGDPSQIKLVIFNLLLNAKQSMPGTGSILLSTRNLMIDGNSNGFRFSGNRPFVELIIRDTGNGMDAETLQHIFEPFFSTHRRGLGKGLGLASTRGIVANHHGYIYADSKQGEGSRFTIFLPAALDAVPDGQ